MYQRACDANDGMGCANLAGLYYYGKGNKIDKDKANELFKKSCDLGIDLGCGYVELINNDKY